MFFSGALPQAFTDAFLQEYFILAPSATVSFSIRGTNPGANVISLGTSGSNTTPLLCIATNLLNTQAVEPYIYVQQIY